MVSRSTSISTAAAGNQIVAAMRLVLAVSALIIVGIDPAQPAQLATVTYGTLSVYTLYSAALYLLTRWEQPAIMRLDRWAHWGDVAWYVALIALSSGTSSIFFFGFFFAIMAAAFRWGFRSGLRVTLVAVLLFASVGLATAPQGAGFELNRTLVRPIYILVLGYMVAYWGGYEITLRRRLELLRDVSALANPRFGVDRTLGVLLERLRAYYDADACVMVSSEPDRGEYRLRRAGRGDGDSADHPTSLPAELTQQLLALPPTQALVYRRQRASRWTLRSRAQAIDIVTCRPQPADAAQAELILATLEAATLLTIPLRHRDATLGRLFVLGAAGSTDLGDVELLLQIFEQVTPVIDNIRLVDRLASEAAEQERQRIARDIHDSVIQPYIGLQIGISALQRKYAEQGAGADIGADLAQLSALTAEGIAELRGYVGQLKRSGAHSGNLAGAIERFAARFGAATGICVAVRTTGDVRCNDRLGAEVFQMVAEGLSNIRRHTDANSAEIALARTGNQLVLRIANVRRADTLPKHFTPRSITERAAALGGTTQLEQHPASTAVEVNIPL